MAVPDPPIGWWRTDGLDDGKHDRIFREPEGPGVRTRARLQRHVLHLPRLLAAAAVAAAAGARVAERRVPPERAAVPRRAQVALGGGRRLLHAVLPRLGREREAGRLVVLVLLGRRGRVRRHRVVLHRRRRPPVLRICDTGGLQRERGGGARPRLGERRVRVGAAGAPSAWNGTHALSRTLYKEWPFTYSYPRQQMSGSGSTVGRPWVLQNADGSLPTVQTKCDVEPDPANGYVASPDNCARCPFLFDEACTRYLGNPYAWPGLEPNPMGGADWASAEYRAWVQNSAGYFDDPGHTILNDGVVAETILPNNTVLTGISEHWLEQHPTKVEVSATRPSRPPARPPARPPPATPHTASQSPPAPRLTPSPSRAQVTDQDHPDGAGHLYAYSPTIAPILLDLGSPQRIQEIQISYVRQGVLDGSDTVTNNAQLVGNDFTAYTNPTSMIVPVRRASDTRTHPSPHTPHRPLTPSPAPLPPRRHQRPRPLRRGDDQHRALGQSDGRRALLQPRRRRRRRLALGRVQRAVPAPCASASATRRWRCSRSTSPACTRRTTPSRSTPAPRAPPTTAPSGRRCSTSR